MSSAGEEAERKIASHTLAYLRRIDQHVDNMEKLMTQVIDILSRQSLHGDRSDRDNREAFERIERELGRSRATRS